MLARATHVSRDRALWAMPLLMMVRLRTSVMLSGGQRVLMVYELAPTLQTSSQSGGGSSSLLVAPPPGGRPVEPLYPWELGAGWGRRTGGRPRLAIYGQVGL